MQPDNSRPTTPIIPPRDGAAPHIPERDEHREAAANIIRSQIDAALEHHDPVGTNATVDQIEAEPTTAPQSAPQPAPSPQTTPSGTSTLQPDEQTANPYHHTHSATEPVNSHTGEQWQKYHSAWQRYYQEYYSRYYVGELYKSQTELMKRADETAEARKSEEGMSQSEAISDLRSQIRSKIATNAKKVRHSRHFIPVISAVVVMLVFVFLQCNSMIFAAVAAYASPGNIDPANVIVDPNVSLKVPADQNNRLIIPKLNIDVPVDFKATPDYDSQMAAMKNGVSYFGINGANAKPGEVGNFGIAGHSSNQWYDTGAYKFIFVNLTELKKGDSFYINYGGTRYTYTVTRTKTVDPNDLSALQDNSTKPEATLITCVPIGTANQRLLVTGEQVSPSPDKAKKNTNQNSSSSDAKMPGNSPTVLEKLFR